MTFAEFQNRTSAYLDGELSHWTRWKVDLHLRACPECAECLADIREVDLLVAGSVFSRPEPSHLTYSIMARLPAMPPAWKRRAFRPVLAGMAVACAQVLALGGAYWWGFTQGGAPDTAPGAGPSASMARGTGGGGGNTVVPVALTHTSRTGSGTTTPSVSSPTGPLWSMPRFRGLATMTAPTVPNAALAGVANGPRETTRVRRPALGAPPAMVPAGAR